MSRAVSASKDAARKRSNARSSIRAPTNNRNRVTANIWFAAHECAVHEMPNAFGDVGWVIFDESPLDAFMFGVDINDEVTLELDTLRTPLPVNRANRASFGGRYGDLMSARKTLYHTLDKLQVPIEFIWAQQSHGKTWTRL